MIRSDHVHPIKCAWMEHIGRYSCAYEFETKIKISGCVGLVIFSDPGDVAVQGTEPENVYPNTIFLPGSGIQRGSTFIGDGDPLSPEWPSVQNAYRLKPEEVKGLPKIPAQPIGYDSKMMNSSI